MPNVATDPVLDSERARLANSSHARYRLFCITYSGAYFGLEQCIEIAVATCLWTHFKDSLTVKFDSEVAHVGHQLSNPITEYWLCVELGWCVAHPIYPSLKALEADR